MEGKKTVLPHSQTNFLFGTLPILLLFYWGQDNSKIEIVLFFPVVQNIFLLLSKNQHSSIKSALFLKIGRLFFHSTLKSFGIFYLIFNKVKPIIKPKTEGIVLKVIPDKPTYESLDPENKLVYDIMESAKLENWKVEVEADISHHSKTWTINFESNTPEYYAPGQKYPRKLRGVFATANRYQQAKCLQTDAFLLQTEL